MSLAASATVPLTPGDEAPLVIALASGAEFWCWPRARYCETRYRDGSRVPAAPQDDRPEYAAHARALGYDGPDPGWAMCCEHELLHSLLAWPHVSPTLWDVAHGLTGQAHHWGEEERVLDAQRTLCAVRRATERA